MAEPVICLALTLLYNNVVQQFADDCIQIPNIFGWRGPQKQKLSRSRINWVPGTPTGDAGSMAPPRNPGRNPRPLGTLLEKFHVRINAANKCDPEDELLQYEAARILFDAWYRAVYLHAHGTFTIDATNWNINKNERRHGAELVVIGTIQAMIPDKKYSTAPVDTGAVIDVSMLDITEQVIVP